jgi:HlyD family secretion protein
MRSGKKWVALVVVVVLVVAAGGLLHKRGGASFLQAEVTRGEIVSTINSTGTVQPVKTLRVGSVVGGRVVKVNVSANSEVKKGQVLAEIDSTPNSEHSKVICPVDGIVIDRKVDEEQILGEHQGGELFVIAQDLKKEVYVFATINESDIGLIRNAKLESQPVTFTVDAYPDKLFPGKIEDIRINPTDVQNVIYYHVVVSAPNGELKLLPGMTAKLSFQIDKRANVIKIPNAALRYVPKADVVHPDDRHLLEGTGDDTSSETTAATTDNRAAADRVKDRQKEKETRRTVWTQVGQWLRGVEVVTGVNDNDNTEMVSGSLTPDQKLVIGVK